MFTTRRGSLAATAFVLLAAGKRRIPQYALFNLYAPHITHSTSYRALAHWQDLVVLALAPGFC